MAHFAGGDHEAALKVIADAVDDYEFEQAMDALNSLEEKSESGNSVIQ